MSLFEYESSLASLAPCATIGTPWLWGHTLGLFKLYNSFQDHKFGMVGTSFSLRLGQCALIFGGDIVDHRGAIVNSCPGEVEVVGSKPRLFAVKDKN